MPYWIHLQQNDSSFPHTLPKRMYSERLNRNAGIFNDIDLELNINDQIYFSSTISSTKSYFFLNNEEIMSENEHSNRP